jgi:hypothetical protein
MYHLSVWSVKSVSFFLCIHIFEGSRDSSVNIATTLCGRWLNYWCLIPRVAKIYLFSVQTGSGVHATSFLWVPGDISMWGVADHSPCHHGMVLN